MKTISSLKKIADTIFSIFIRKKYADHRGYVKCYTCGVVRMWNDRMQCGHFNSRRIGALRYEPRNCRVQCMGCNYMARGNYGKFAANLIRECGEEEILWLDEQASQPFRFTIEGLENIIEYFRNEVAKL